MLKLFRASTWIALSALLVQYVAASGDLKKVKTVPTAGTILIQVFNRETPSTPEDQFKEDKAIVRTGYGFSEDNDSSLLKSKSFSGSVSIPVQIKVEDDLAHLNLLEISDSRSNKLASFSGASMQDLKRAAKNGVSILAILTVNQDAGPEIRVIKNSSLPSNVQPDQNFRSVKEVFLNPSDVLTASDIEATLASLREIATATDEYHKELVQLVKDARSLDAAHLQMLTDAVYFTYADRERMSKELEELQRKAFTQSFTEETIKTIRAIQNNIYLADRLGGYANTIINLGLPKIRELHAEDASKILALAFPSGNLTEAFNAALAVAGPLNGEGKLKWMDFAISKDESLIARDLAIDWFKNDSDRKLETLIHLAGKFNWGAKDSLLKSALPLFSKLTSAELVQIVGVAYESKESIALLGLEKIQPLVSQDAVTLAGVLTWNAKDNLIGAALNRMASLTTAEIIALSQAAYEHQASIPIQHIAKISDLNTQNATKVAAYLQWDNKDLFLSGYLGRVSKLSTDEWIQISNASYSNKQSVLLQNIDRISDLTVSNAIKVSQSLNWDNKDIFLNAFMGKTSSILTQDLLQISAACYEHKQAIILKNIGKASDKAAAQIVSLSQALSYENKDRLITGYLKISQVRVTTAELVSLSNAAYESKASIDLDYLAQVSDLTAENLVTIQSRRSYQDRDTAALRGIALLGSITPLTLTKLVSAGYEKRADIAIAADRLLPSISTEELHSVLSAVNEAGRLSVAKHYLGKVSDLSPKAAAKFATLMSWGAKDLFLSTYMARGGSISAADLITVASAAYENKPSLILDHLERVNNLTVDNAVLLASNVSWDDKDRLLLRIVDLVSDLSTVGANKLSNAGYAKKKEILDKALRRIGTNSK